MSTFKKRGAVEAGIERLLLDLSKRAPAESKMPSEEIGSIPAAFALVLEWTPAPKGMPPQKWKALARLLRDESRRLQVAIVYKDAGLVQEQASRVKHDVCGLPQPVPRPRRRPPADAAASAKGEKDEPD